ncbi:MAG: YdcF family protein [Polyangiaceae bacterium]
MFARAGEVTRRLPPARDMLRAAGVGAAAFLLVNVLGEAVRPPFDTLGEWMSWPFDPSLRRALATIVAVALLASAFVKSRPVWLRAMTAAVFSSVALLASVDVLGVFDAIRRGLVIAPSPIPASAVVAGFFGALAWEASAVREREGAESASPGPRARLVRVLVIGILGMAIPLLQMATFGLSRYERPADCAVVFGARVYSNGRPSMALADRVDEAVRLYQRGLVKRLVMSGAIDGDAGFSEPRVMAERAVAEGVPPEAILIDEEGVDTASTVRNTARWMHEEGLSRALVVTHYYHEPRAKMLFDRAGVQAYTVPAHMSRRLAKEPYFLLREIVAYYHSFLLE